MSGDGAKRDADGYIWITGRIDDMLNCSGKYFEFNQFEGLNFILRYFERGEY